MSESRPGRWCSDPHPEQRGFTYAPVHFHPSPRSCQPNLDRTNEVVDK